MADFTPPPWNAANFSFERAEPYLSPAWNAANFRFRPPDGQALGYMVPQYGTARLNPLFAFSAGVVTKYGDVSGRQFWAAEGFRSTRYGRHSTPTNRTLTASGQLATQYGWHVAFAALPPVLDSLCQARGVKAAKYGKHRAVPDKLTLASGWQVTRYGVHGLSLRQSASGAKPTLYGTHTARVAQVSAGKKLPQYGQHTATIHHQAKGLLAKVRYGKHQSIKQWSHPMYPSRKHARYGYHRGWTAFMCPASGLDVTRYGSHDLRQAHLMRPAARVARYGRHTLVRDQTC